MFLNKGDIKTYFDVFGYDSSENLGATLFQTDSFESAEKYAKSLNYKDVRYYNDIELHLDLHVIKVISEVLN